MPKSCINEGIGYAVNSEKIKVVCLTIRFKTPLKPYVSGEPINDPINDPLNGLINGPLKVIVGRVYEIIVASPGIKKGEIAKQITRARAL